MRPKQIVPLLAQMMTAGEQVLLVGAPGIGKTDMVKQACKAAGFDLVVKHPAVEDPTDARGLPAMAPSGDHATFVAFGDLWQAINATRPTFYLLDDLGQAGESTLKAYMQFLWGRRLNGHALPECVVFGAATNDVGQKSGVTGIIEPVKSRFSTIIHVEPSVEDWIEWGMDHGMPGILLAFMSDPAAVLSGTSTHLLFNFEPTKEMKNSPCPRTWAHLGRLWNLGIRDAEVFWGAVGKPAATQFLTYAEIAEKLPSVNDILLNPTGAPLPDKASHQYLVGIALGRAVSASCMGPYMTYLKRLPQAIRFMSLRVAGKEDSRRPAADQIKTTTEYVTWSLKEGTAVATWKV